MVKVLNVPLYDKDIPSSVEELMQDIFSDNKKSHCISATGAHGIVYAMKNIAFKQILNDFYLNLPDGMPGVWIGRLKGAKQMKRCYGPNFFREVVITSASTKIKHFLCGGKEGIAEELKKKCVESFGNNNIVDTFCPPFREMSETEMRVLGERINSSGADIVWIGLSTPKQEQFAAKLKGYVNVHFIITVGAAFDFHTGKVKQAPSWVQHIGMEWLFRLTKEPRRLYKRYLKVVPLFIYYNLRELIKFTTYQRFKTKN